MRVDHAISEEVKRYLQRNEMNAYDAIVALMLAIDMPCDFIFKSGMLSDFVEYEDKQCKALRSAFGFSVELVRYFKNLAQEKEDGKK